MAFCLVGIFLLKQYNYLSYHFFFLFLFFLFSDTSFHDTLPVLNFSLSSWLLGPSPINPGIESASDAPPAVIRYSLDQRPTSLPIQPFTFHHQFPSKQAQPKPLLPLLSGYVSGMQARGSSESAAGGPLDEDSENIAENVDTYREALTGAADPGPGSVRPSPLGSYSPVRLQGPQSSGTCSTCTPSPHPPPQPPAQRPQNLSSPRSEGPILSQGKQEVRSVPLLLTPPLSSSMKRGAGPTLLPPLQDHCYHRETPPILSGLQSDTLSPLGIMESGKHGEGGEGDGTRTQNGMFQVLNKIVYNVFFFLE